MTELQCVALAMILLPDARNPANAVPDQVSPALRQLADRHGIKATRFW